MTWERELKGFKSYLMLERSLSPNTVEAYLSDVEKLNQYLSVTDNNFPINQVSKNHLKAFIKELFELGLTPTSQSRIISGIKAFFKYLIMENKLEIDPTEYIEQPKTSRKLPDTLSIDEIDLLIGAIDRSKPEGERNKAMLETLYSCGLRVSELISLKISDLFFKDGFIKVTGKGSKQRLVPIGNSAIKQVNIYRSESRNHIDIKKGFEDILFLNRNGRSLTRVMVFTIIRQLAVKIGLNKTISPHTFRHSFATHLIDGGANLRAVQEMLGHSSITTTEIYTHLDKLYLREAIIQFHPRS